jgi:hypothetical protein
MLTGDVTAPALFEEISLHHRTLLIDEAEKMQKRHSPLREILNSGYRRGSSVLRKGVRYDIYSPKVLALIGDLEDSLRDRCIIIEMTRIKQGAARRRLVQAIAIEEGHDIELAIAAVVEARLEEIRSVYLTYDDQSLAFLPDRDKEIWTPMFSICSVFAPERIAGLKRTAIDIATLKTWKVRRSVDLEKEGERASHLEYGEQLIHDCLKVLAERDRIPTAELVEALWAEDEYPWRKYEGGVTAEKLSSMLKPFGVAPKTIRVGPKGPTGSTLKGYYRADFLKMKKPT